MRSYDGLTFLLAAVALLAGASHTESATSFISPSVGSSCDEARATAAVPGMLPYCRGDEEDRSRSPLLSDADVDGFQDEVDNCITVFNPGQEDGDGDEVGDACDACPNTASGDPVDGDGCSTADDDGDGVLNDQDACSDTATGGPVDASGCSTGDDDGDGVLNDEDDCPDTLGCAEVGSDGCPLDGDDDGVPDGCEPPPQEGGCCGAGGPVAPLGLAVGMLLMSRYGGYRRVRRRR